MPPPPKPPPPTQLLPRPLPPLPPLPRVPASDVAALDSRPSRASDSSRLRMRREPSSRAERTCACERGCKDKVAVACMPTWSTLAHGADLSSDICYLV
eukprot:365284-Chlamydomonas_euryale.AAC.1